MVCDVIRWLECRYFWSGRARSFLLCFRISCNLNVQALRGSVPYHRFRPYPICLARCLGMYKARRGVGHWFDYHVFQLWHGFGWHVCNVNVEQDTLNYIYGYPLVCRTLSFHDFGVYLHQETLSLTSICLLVLAWTGVSWSDKKLDTGEIPLCLRWDPRHLTLLPVPSPCLAQGVWN